VNKKFFFPKKLQDDELFKKILEIVDEFIGPIEASFIDVSDKYSSSNELPIETIIEILNEYGLGSIGNLLAVSPVIDVYSVLGYVQAINALKGSEQGYFLVLDLLGFSYETKAWYEQVPQNDPMTFELDVNLDASVTNKPYETFQRIKLFTRDYILPIISPLGYTYNVPITSPTITLKGAVHPDYLSIINVTINPTLVGGKSNFILVDANGQQWRVVVNNAGQYFSHKVEDKEVIPFNIIIDNELFRPEITTNGAFYLINTVSEYSLQYSLGDLTFSDHLGNEYVFNAPVFYRHYNLLTENDAPILLENNEPILLPYYFSFTTSILLENDEPLLLENNELLVTDEPNFTLPIFNPEDYFTFIDDKAFLN
jgi:hypothetical protein